MRLNKRQTLALHQTMRRHIEGDHYHDHMGATIRELLAAFSLIPQAVSRCEGCRDFAYSDIGLCERCEPESVE